MVRFGEQSVWESKSSRGRHGCGILKSIFKVKDLFWGLTRFQLGMGHDIRFWQDIWIGDLPLKDRFGTGHE